MVSLVSSLFPLLWGKRWSSVSIQHSPVSVQCDLNDLVSIPHDLHGPVSIQWDVCGPVSIQHDRFGSVSVRWGLCGPLSIQRGLFGPVSIQQGLGGCVYVRWDLCGHVSVQHDPCGLLSLEEGTGAPWLSSPMQGWGGCRGRSSLPAPSAPPPLGPCRCLARPHV